MENKEQKAKLRAIERKVLRAVVEGALQIEGKLDMYENELASLRDEYGTTRRDRDEIQKAIERTVVFSNGVFRLRDKASAKETELLCNDD